MPQNDSTPEGMIRMSPSSLTRWYEDGCPARWKFGREWELKEKNEFAERGILVHAMMEGTIDPGDVKDTLAQSFYRKLDDVRRNLGLIHLHSELKQAFEIVPGVWWVRKIDWIAKFPDGAPIILDWKTGGASWKTLPNGIAPQSLGFASEGYLWPDSTPVKGIDSWPTTVIYVSVGFRGPATFHRYDQNLDGMENFTGLLKMSVASILHGHKLGFRKAAGRKCLDCEMRHACYQLPKWRRLYVKRRYHD